MTITAYPNPTTDLITVSALNNNYQSVSFAITDISGRVLGQYDNPSISASNISQIIDASSYAQGIYLITMIADSRKYSIKFVKE
jgi:hypothetical protein